MTHVPIFNRVFWTRGNSIKEKSLNQEYFWQIKKSRPASP
jgi:hypothetical protein